MATSYSTLTKLNTYWAARGDPAEWTAATDAQKALAALESSEYLDRKYGFRGRPETTTQERQWPRSGAYNDHDQLVEGVPPQIEDSVAILALEYLKGERFLERIDAGTTTGEVESEMVQVGSIRIASEFVAGSSGGSTFARFPKVDSTLARAGLLEDGTERRRG